MGACLAGLVVMVSILGPFVRPYSTTDLVGAPLDAPSAAHWLGTDELGRDVFSRLLSGGLLLLGVSLLATFLAYVVGLLVGMTAGYRRRGFDLGTIALVDVIVSFPPIVFVLILLAATGPRISIIIAGIAAVHAPRIVRIVRSVTIEVSSLEYVEAALARGENLRNMLRREVLPNIWVPVLADAGLRLTGSVILYSSLSYLGLGPAPPASDWGLMISENRVGLSVQPWSILGPACMIAILTIGVNLIADAIARNVGVSVTRRDE